MNSQTTKIYLPKTTLNGRTHFTALLGVAATLTAAFTLTVLVPHSAIAEEETPVVLSAQAVLLNNKGETKGTIGFSETTKGVTLNISASDLSPGPHGIHFHEKDVCEGDFTSAGGHFNPDGKKHGLENKSGAHIGDLPNLDVPKSGEVVTHIVAEHVTLKEGKYSLLAPVARSIVIHEGKDDQKSDPAGNSGKRVLCGVITKGELNPTAPKIASQR